MGQREAAIKLQISQPLLCKLLKKRVEIENSATLNKNPNIKRIRSGKEEQVESALLLWFINVRKNDARINGPILRQKAEELAKKMGIENFIASEGWFYRWKKRENIVYKRTYGEQKDADFSAAENWLKTEWPKIISEYTPDNVYNADETGLFYRALPEHSYLLKNENAKGCKISIERITVLCCASMSGKKQKLLAIGKSKNPRCFKSVKCLPVDYYANINAWMTSVIFNEWLIKWDK
ncbi:tigger transposable element-derived protein 6-like [Myzus persicae]|uniref:tigger transposable element-derived protein 6-like n=1 Tax=Myzus persicae TaxID=13164 RepID=UPI000B937643|nr:tigger transposable element-derived protein 6-like [Myzus persicae]